MILEAMPSVLVDTPLAAGLAPRACWQEQHFVVCLQYFLNFSKETYSLWLLLCWIHTLYVNGTGKGQEKLTLVTEWIVVSNPSLLT